MSMVTNKWKNNSCKSVLAIIVLFVIGCAPIDTSNDLPNPTVDPFQSVERKILDATDQSYEEGDAGVAYLFKRQMEDWEISPSQEIAFAYWKAFLNFNLARLEQYFGDSEQSLELIDQAIVYLNGVDKVDAELQALRAILLKSKIPFASDDTFELLVAMRDNLANALVLDETNLRSQLASAMDAVILIPGFGAGANPDEVMQTALDMDSESTIGSTLFAFPPTWGREEVLALQVIHLSNLGQADEAASILELALEEYPNHFMLKMLDNQEPD